MAFFAACIGNVSCESKRGGCGSTLLVQEPAENATVFAKNAFNFHVSSTDNDCVLGIDWRVCIHVKYVTGNGSSSRVCVEPSLVMGGADFSGTTLVGDFQEGNLELNVFTLTARQAEKYLQEPYGSLASVLDHATMQGRVRFSVSNACRDKFEKLDDETCEHSGACEFQGAVNMIESAVCYEEWGTAYRSSNHLPRQKRREKIVKAFMEDKPPLYDFIGVLSGSRSLFGETFNSVAFGFGDRMFLEFILQRHPGVKNIVEFGVYRGVTSLYLGMSTSLRGGSLSSFDREDLRSDAVKRSWLGNMKFFTHDLENPAGISEVAVNLLGKADLLFNDGGDKDLESRIYANFLPIGALLFQHDFSYEHTDRGQSGYFLENLGFEALYEDVAKYLNSCGRVWVRRKNSL